MSEETRTMQTADTTTTRAPEDAPALVKKIGKTTYKVRVHFSQTRRVFEFGQLQVGGDDHGPAAAVAAVNDEKHLLHSIFGTALYSQIVNDKQVILVKAGNKLRPVLREHPCQAVQNGGEVRHRQPLSQPKTHDYHNKLETVRAEKSA